MQLYYLDVVMHTPAGRDVALCVNFDRKMMKLFIPFTSNKTKK